MDLDELLQIDPLNQLKMLMNIGSFSRSCVHKILGSGGQTFDQTRQLYQFTQLSIGIQSAPCYCYKLETIVAGRILKKGFGFTRMITS
ncbi:hypothetical protein BpHYR1_011423 [Brachionus plicatilis]|uniref:Uncharacterized protein n=1 Tax=Brachionus plicatilis TaxID=10195 RepID=A0A3M7RFB7_BRAPC|nr:hypothetical protein BpHYR1_011423 [Brachionus plicatilis]